MPSKPRSRPSAATPAKRYGSSITPKTPSPQGTSTHRRTGSPGSRRYGSPPSRATPSSKPGTSRRPRKASPPRWTTRPARMTSSGRSSSATWPPSKPPSTTPRPPAPTPHRPSTSSASPGTPPAWTGCSKSARPSSRTPSCHACNTSTTASMTGRPPSARSSVKRRDLAGQLGQRIHPHIRHPAGIRVIPLNPRPRTPPDQRRPQARSRCGHDVVIEPVARVQDAGRIEGHSLDHAPEERRVWLRSPPVVRGCDHVGGQLQAPQDAARPACLVPSDADPQAVSPQSGQCRAGIGIQVVLAEPFRLALIGPLLPSLR